MNSMLYIIVGLVIILMIGVWVVRKNKAQQPRAQSIDKGDSAPTTAPAKRVSSDVANTATKFDDIAIAQRFIDQQRYDKAIETLERGLAEKPNDGELSLKLLNVYALSDQKEAFFNTYAAITAHGDRVTIAQARQLKELLNGEQNEALGISENSDETIPDYESIDFDKNILIVDAAVNNTPEYLEENTAPDTSSHNISNDLDNDSFVLTLDDLETDDLEPDLLLDHEIVEDKIIDTSADNAQKSVPERETEALVLDFDMIDSTDDTQLVNDHVVSDNDDFVLDFDGLLDDSLEVPADTHDEDKNTLSNDDFDLDFNDLSPATTVASEQQPIVPSTSADAVNVNDDFTLFLDEIEQETTILDTVSTAPVITEDSSQTLKVEDSILDAEILENSIVESDSLYSDSLESAVIEHNILENSLPNIMTPSVSGSVSEQTLDGFDLDNLDLNSIDFDIESDIDYDINTVVEPDADQTSSTPVLDDSLFTLDDSSNIDTLDFDDNLDSINDVSELVTDLSITTMAPVTSENSLIDVIEDYQDTSSSVSFDADFAADFDFVNTLDSHQVTLDLASQYLKLGEYDSAKRLLNEVVMQGNSEQQQQAQALLARTA